MSEIVKTAEQRTQAPPAPGVEASQGPKLWRVGTLTYTATGLAVLFFWLLWGDFSFYFKERSVPQVLQRLLATFNTRPAIAGFLIGSLPQIIAMFLSPVISYRSDRHRGRWGRRIPYLFIPTPVAFVSMIGLAYSPAIGRWIQHSVGNGSLDVNGCIVFSFALFWTLFEFSSITCNSVFTGLINDVVPSELLGRFFGLFRVFSLLAGIGFNYYLMGKADEHYQAMFIAIGLLYFVSFSAMCLRVKEGSYPRVSGLKDAPVAPSAGGFFSAVKTYFRDCFSHPYYCWYFLSFALAYMAFLPVNIFIIFYATNLKMDMTTYGWYAALQLTCSLIQAYPLGWLADKLHPIRVTVAATALYAVACLVAFLYISTPTGLGVAVVACGTIAGMWLTVSSPLSPLLFPKAKFATFSSAMSLCSSVGTLVLSPLCGWFIERMDNEYRYIYLLACVFMTLSLVATLVVYKKFMALGGPKNYVAPE